MSDFSNDIVIRQAEKTHAQEIARLIMHLPCVGLLVDKGNPDGEALYSSVGFRYMNDSQWGGHEMKHLIL